MGIRYNGQFIEITSPAQAQAIKACMDDLEKAQANKELEKARASVSGNKALVSDGVLLLGTGNGVGVTPSYTFGDTKDSKDLTREKLDALGKQYGATQNADGTYSLSDVAQAYISKNGSAGTFHIGAGVSGSFGGLGGQATIQLTFDGYGNVAIQTTVGGGLGIAATPSGSAFIFAGGTNACLLYTS